MRRLIALALGLCLFANPALAITIGGFTLTAFNSGTNSAHASTHTVSLTGNTTVPAGDIIAIFGASHLNNTADTVIPSDTAGDTFTSKQCPSASGTGYAASIHVAVTSGLVSGNTISISDTVTGGTAFSDANVTAYGIHGGKSSSIDDAVVAACSANASSVNSGAITSNAGSVSGNLLLSVLGSIGVTLGTITEDGSWTGIYQTGDASIIYVGGGIVDANTAAVTRTVTWSGTARPYYMAVLALQAAAGGGATPVCNLSTLGVGGC